MISRDQLISFYTRCEKEKITSINDKFEERKAEQIALAMGISFDKGIQKLFEAAKSITMQTRENAEIARLKKESIEAKEKAFIDDSKEYEKLTKYSDLYGAEKVIQMVSDDYKRKIEFSEAEYESLNSKAISAHEGANAVMKLTALTSEKEKDWAVAGGIAQGIAGGAAGLATAISVQNQNAAIRARNAENAKTAAKVSMMMGTQGYDYERKAAAAKNRVEALKYESACVIEQYRIKVIGEEDDETVFHSVAVDNIKYSISPIGSVKITCEISAKGDCTIFGDRPAYIDGTLCAKIFQDEKLIGVADLVLPMNGLKKSVVTIKGICLCDADQNKPCRITVIPKNLWKMEA